MRNDPEARKVAIDLMKGTLENFRKAPFTLQSKETLVELKNFYLFPDYKGSTMTSKGNEII